MIFALLAIAVTIAIGLYLSTKLFDYFYEDILNPDRQIAIGYIAHPTIRGLSMRRTSDKVVCHFISPIVDNIQSTVLTELIGNELFAHDLFEYSNEWKCTRLTVQATKHSIISRSEFTRLQ